MRGAKTKSVSLKGLSLKIVEALEKQKAYNFSEDVRSMLQEKYEHHALVERHVLRERLREERERLEAKKRKVEALERKLENV